MKADEIVQALLENEQPSPEELVQAVDPLDVILARDPHRHVPCGEHCYRCGAHCTLIHRHSDRLPAPYHICNRCDNETI